MHGQHRLFELSCGGRAGTARLRTSRATTEKRDRASPAAAAISCAGDEVAALVCELDMSTWRACKTLPTHTESRILTCRMSLRVACAIEGEKNVRGSAMVTRVWFMSSDELQSCHDASAVLSPPQRRQPCRYPSRSRMITLVSADARRANFRDAFATNAGPHRCICKWKRVWMPCVCLPPTGVPAHASPVGSACRAARA